MPRSVRRIAEKIVTNRAFAPLVGPLLQVALLASRSSNNTKNLVVISYDHALRAEGVNLIRRIYAERDMRLSLPEAYSIYSAVKQTAKVPGDVAEVGVYQGGSAKLICGAKGTRHLHLFDTFAGLPPRQEVDLHSFTEGRFACSLDSVRQYLSQYSGISYYEGFFPGTAASISASHRFSFVHIDVDLYESTRSCLEFFYPRMSPGGVLISHDYFAAGGVKAAFDEFLSDRPEPLIELAGDQCMIVKIA